MKIGMVGMGKLGFPCALAMADKGHEVVGFDLSEAPYSILASRKYPHREIGAQELLETTTLCMVRSYAYVVAHADVVFVAVQTPHQPEFEGLNRMPDRRVDFSYDALKEAVTGVVKEAAALEKRVVVVVISTCLPGTCDREITPLLNKWTGFVYSPYFIAMGTTIADFIKPEYQLLGSNNPCGEDLALVQEFYRSIHDRPHKVMSVASAELNKVGYNVFLGLKIIAANSLMEIAHKTPGVNVDDVTDGLALATDRVVSPKYMRGGMGDGGACHPRDQIALSWLAEKLDLSYDLFGSMVKAREQQTEWLAYLALEEALKAGIEEVVVLGKAYKKGTNLTYGSPAILLRNILDEFVQNGEWGGKIHQWDPHVDGGVADIETFPSPGRRWAHTWGDGSGWASRGACVFVVAADHDEFFSPDFRLPRGSIVVDPWGKFANREGIKVIRIGRGDGVASAG